MLQVTGLPASSMTSGELNAIAAAYLAVDRARIYRRLFLVRFGLLASASAIIAMAVPGLSAMARWFPPMLFLAPPTWACLVELRLTRRLADLLKRI
jgi:hypothetical protein